MWGYGVELGAEVYMVTMQTHHIYLEYSLSLNAFVHPSTGTTTAASFYVFSTQPCTVSLLSLLSYS